MTKANSILPKPPSKRMAMLLRLPIWLYKLGLGWMLGNRFLMIEHIGRKSGLKRKTVLEVVRHDKLDDTYYVLSGWGKKADWYQNVIKTPEVGVHVGFRKFTAIARQMAVEIAERELLDYAQNHPVALRELINIIGYQVEPNEEGILKLAQELPVIALKA